MSPNMSADDQAFLDILSSVPNDIRKYSNDVADYVDRHLEQVSNVLREALSSSKWIPESARPRPPPPPPRSFAPSSASSASIHSQVCNWAVKNKVLAAIIISVAAGTTFYIIRRKTSRKKRRAKRAANGARLEVVVIAGQPSEPITRSISLDLERRGFIVYVVCNSIEEEVIVQNESRPDIKPLMLDIVDVESAKRSIERFTTHLQTPHSAFSGAKSHHLTLRSLIIIPSATYPSSPIATLSPGTYWDLLHSRLLTPIITVQYFLPLLQSLPLHHPTHHPTPPPPKPSILLLTPSIISSLSPAFHLPESSIVSAQASFTSVLTSELSPLNIPVTHLQLGTFDLSAFSPHHRQHQNQQLTIQSQRAETLTWDASARANYGRNYVESTKRLGRGKGSSLRELNDAVFDAMVRGKGGVVRVGMGAGLYSFVGRWVPRGMVGWMMGLRSSVVGSTGEFGREERERSESPRSNGSGGGGGGIRLGESSEFVNVYGEKGAERGEDYLED